MSERTKIVNNGTRNNGTLGNILYHLPISGIRDAVCKTPAPTDFFHKKSASDRPPQTSKPSGYRPMDWAALSDFNETLSALRRWSKVEVGFQLALFSLGEVFLELVFGSILVFFFFLGFTCWSHFWINLTN